MRILITGSRKLKRDKHYSIISSAIGNAIKSLTIEKPNDNEIVIVHGDCPTGADALADEFANKISRLLSVPRENGRIYSLRVERHPANWKKFGKAAGPIRNQEMVDLGFDACLAFPMEDSKGTWVTIEMVRETGVEPLIYHC